MVAIAKKVEEKKVRRDHKKEEEQALRDAVNQILSNNSEVDDNSSVNDNSTTLENKIEDDNTKTVTDLEVDQNLAHSDEWEEHEVVAAQNFYSTSNGFSYSDEPFYLSPSSEDSHYEVEDEGHEEDYNSKSDTMTDREAEVAVEKMVVESVIGVLDLDNLNLKDRERFKNWQQESSNKVLLFLYDGLSIVRTMDTNYGSTL